MSMALVHRRVPVIALLVCLAAPFMAACGGGGGGSDGNLNDTDLAVIYFSHRDRTDVYRNQLLEFRFTAPVKESSVDQRTFRILSGPARQTPAPGARIVDGERIYFDPTRSQQVYDRDGVSAKRDIPFGFDALMSYQVYVPGPPELKTLKNLSGSPIVAEWVGNFTTSDMYMPELDPPSFLGFAFEPPPLEDGKIDFYADVILEFDEPINPSTFEPGTTITVYREITIQTPQGPIVKRGFLPINFEPSRDGTRFTLLPPGDWGPNARLTITVTDGVQDLSGNPIVTRPVNSSQTNPFVFLTRDFESEEERAGYRYVDFLAEEFTNNTYEDQTAIPPPDRAEWNSTELGALLGGAITSSYILVQPAPDGNASFLFNVSYPLVADPVNTSCPALATGDWKKGIRMQHSYTQTEMGNKSGTITNIDWGPSSNWTFAATHSNIEIRVGHMENTTGVLGTDFAANFRGGNVPLANYSGDYSIPTNSSAPWWPFPTLTNVFDYDGTSAVLVDYQVSPAVTCQGWVCWAYTFMTGGPGKRTAGAQDRNATVDDGFITNGGRTDNIVYYVRFTKRRRLTFAQSNFYDTQLPGPDYGDPVVSPQTQPGGSTFVLEFQGAGAMVDPLNPTRFIPDPSTYTAWSTNVNDCDGKRFLRFKFSLYANLQSSTVNRIASLTVPYTFQ